MENIGKESDRYQNSIDVPYRCTDINYCSILSQTISLISQGRQVLIKLIYLASGFWADRSLVVPELEEFLFSLSEMLDLGSIKCIFVCATRD